MLLVGKWAQPLFDYNIHILYTTLFSHCATIYSNDCHPQRTVFFFLNHNYILPSQWPIQINTSHNLVSCSILLLGLSVLATSEVIYGRLLTCERQCAFIMTVVALEYCPLRTPWQLYHGKTLHWDTTTMIRQCTQSDKVPASTKSLWGGVDFEQL